MQDHILGRRPVVHIIAALRHWSREVPEDRQRDTMPAHFTNCEPLSLAEIDTLCERLDTCRRITLTED